ncbi:MAG: HEPN domain-containing protein [Gemmatimonadetes bacterium]|nr:HEPN domain-containing protein [Gemmatimonadota bacterium]
MRDASRALLEQAHRSIESARRELAAGDWGFAADRAYYAMFYAAEALLGERNLEYSSHGAVHGAFGKEFAKTKVLDPKLHRWLLQAFKLRQAGMYEAPHQVEPDKAQQLVARAEEFVQAARAYLEAQP